MINDLRMSKIKLLMWSLLWFAFFLGAAKVGCGSFSFIFLGLSAFYGVASAVKFSRDGNTAKRSRMLRDQHPNLFG